MKKGNKIKKIKCFLKAEAIFIVLMFLLSSLTVDANLAHKTDHSSDLSPIIENNLGNTQGAESSETTSRDEDLKESNIENNNCGCGSRSGEDCISYACIADIVFVIDTTGSMGVLSTVKNIIQVVLTGLFEDYGREFLVGGVEFGDEIRGSFSLTDDYIAFDDWVQSLSAWGGGDGPENQLDALWAASEMNFRQNAKKFFILFTKIIKYTC